MAKDIIPVTPTRRSKRFQPLATPSGKPTTQLDCFWDGQPIYTRCVNPDLDLLQDERDELSQEEINDLETVFYDGLSMKTQKTKIYRGGKSNAKKRRAEETRQIYRIGDTILIETDTLYRVRRPPSVAVIVAMWECRSRDVFAGQQVDSRRMRLRVHWFLRPTELASIRAKREHAENEVYYSLESNEIILPEVVVSHCTVFGKGLRRKNKVTIARKGKGREKIPGHCSDDESGSEGEDNEEEDPEENFSCNLVVDSYRGLFYDFHWDAHRKSVSSLTVPQEEDPSWGNGITWNVAIREPKRSNKKKRKLDEIESDTESKDEHQASEDTEDKDDETLDGEVEGDRDSDVGEPLEEDVVMEPRTPSKKRVRRDLTTPRKAATTPRKRTKTFAQPTPHSKAAARRLQASPSKKKQRFTVRPRAAFPSAMSEWNLNLLKMPKDPWLRAMHMLHVGNRPDSLPCRDAEFENVLRCVGELLEDGSGGCVYISGVPGTGKTATVHSVVTELKRMAENNETNPFTFVEINGLRLPEPSAAYNLLWEAVSGHDAAKDGHLSVSSKESLKALTRYFSGGAGRGPGGHACIVLMDELDQLVTNKQDVVYNFFNWPTLAGSKLVVIAVANTMDLPERVMTGRVRSRLGMIRINFQPYTRTQLETIVRARLGSAQESLGQGSKSVIEEKAITMASMKVSGISGDARRVLDICRRTVELAQPDNRTATIKDVQEVFRAMQHNPIVAYLQDCSFHERLMLASLVKCMKREGVDEIKWGEICHQHLIYMSVIPTDSDPKTRPTANELLMVRDSLSASRAVVVEEGAMVARKHEDERRILLNIEQGEVERVLSDVGGNAWRNILCS
ncbi:P-loop containing nucleoside triphosphate hydrolase protein [Macrolepiota fuliginosa MF-IS2]|uniref:Origin recognition complex subunit 1 n=1 Tax=Macrolepiota fuliginosa MF-IS2 TaxID=1400762 RepID=A0A9P5XPG1_9AGAR|nr:P-loop containing nucleoside triphosphate hydrolase protein [Macrolepiota fuliginosa MF-IS2]